MVVKTDDRVIRGWMNDAISVFRFINRLPADIKRLIFMQVIEEERIITGLSLHSDEQLWDNLLRQIYTYASNREYILGGLGFKQREKENDNIFADSNLPSISDYECPYEADLPSVETLGGYYNEFMVQIETDTLSSTEDVYIQLLKKNKIVKTSDQSNIQKYDAFNAFKSWILDSSTQDSTQNSFNQMFYWYTDGILIDEVIFLLLRVQSCRLRQALINIIKESCIDDQNLLQIFHCKFKLHDIVNATNLVNLLPEKRPDKFDSLGVIKMDGNVSPKEFAECLYDIFTDTDKIRKIETELMNDYKSGNAQTSRLRNDINAPILSMPKTKKEIVEQRSNFIKVFLPNEKVKPIALNCKKKLLTVIYCHIKNNNIHIGERLCDIFSVWKENNVYGSISVKSLTTNSHSNELEDRFIKYIIDNIKHNSDLIKDSL